MVLSSIIFCVTAIACTLCPSMVTGQSGQFDAMKILVEECNQDI